MESGRYFLFNKSSSILSVREETMTLVNNGVLNIRDAIEIVHKFNEYKRDNITYKNDYIKIMIEDILEKKDID